MFCDRPRLPRRASLRPRRWQRPPPRQRPQLRRAPSHKPQPSQPKAAPACHSDAKKAVRFRLAQVSDLKRPIWPDAPTCSALRSIARSYGEAGLRPRLRSWCGRRSRPFAQRQLAARVWQSLPSLRISVQVLDLALRAWLYACRTTSSTRKNARCMFSQRRGASSR